MGKRELKYGKIQEALLDGIYMNYQIVNSYTVSQKWKSSAIV